MSKNTSSSNHALFLKNPLSSNENSEGGGYLKSKYSDLKKQII
ncbi:hypothetical protein [Campylobacter bilis]|nr:hypothetical protein [Campylobacter bilis]